jgi:TolA-binding protein
MPLLRASRFRLQYAPFLVLAAILPFAAGCGDSKQGRLLSANQASDLRATLSQVQQDVAADNCTGAKQQVAALQEQIDGIRRLDRNLRSALRSSTRRLETLVNDKCAPATTTTTPTETTPTTPNEGASGASGSTGASGGQGKKPKKEKPPKKTPPGQDENGPPGQQGGGGGAGLPGESVPNGNGGN